TSAITPPTNSISSANVRYSVPISLWLVVVTQRMIHGRTPFGRCPACTSIAVVLIPKLSLTSPLPSRSIRPRHRGRRVLGDPIVEFLAGHDLDDDRHIGVI